MNSNNVQPNGRDAAPPPAHPINSTYPARRLRRPKGWLQDLICCSTVKYIELHDGRTYAIYEDGFRGLCNWTVGDFDTFSRDPDFEEIPVPENKIGLHGFSKNDAYAKRGTSLVIQNYSDGVYRLGRDEAYNAYSDFMVAEKCLDYYFTTDKLDTYVGRSGYWKSPLGEAEIGDPVKITGRLPGGWFVTDRPGCLGTGLEIAPHEIDLFFTEANPAPERKFKPGDRVLIARGALWTGTIGEVVKHCSDRLTSVRVIFAAHDDTWKPKVGDVGAFYDADLDLAVCGKNVPHHYERAVPADYRALKFGEIRTDGDKWFSVVSGWLPNYADDVYSPCCNLSVRPIATAASKETFIAHYIVDGLTQPSFDREADAVEHATKRAKDFGLDSVVYKAVKQVSVELEEKVTIKEAV